MFSFSLPRNKQKRVVVFILHVHIGRVRRFAERFHTMVIAVLSPKEGCNPEEWVLDMELSMKQDFGLAMVAVRPRKNAKPMDEAQAKIRVELSEKGERR